MSRAQISEALNIANQTIPFLMITATFIFIAYTYGNSVTASPLEDVYECSKIKNLQQFWLS